MTGLIYLAIVALWAAVLVPMWLRRHDQANESRNADRFNTAMRTLSRRPVPYGDHRELLMPRRRHQVEVTVTGARGRVSDPRMAPPAPRRAPSTRPGPAARARARAAARRRRVLLLVGVVLTAAAVGVVRGVVPTWVLLLPATIAVVVVVAGARRPAEARPARSVRPARATSPRPRTERVPAAARTPLDVPRPEAVPAGEPYDAVLDGAWDAVPTTLPTYVTKARASGVPRYIDLRSPGAWDSAAMLEQARSQRRPVSDRELALDAVDEAGLLRDEAEIASYADPFFDQEQEQPRRRAAGA